MKKAIVVSLLLIWSVMLLSITTGEVYNKVSSFYANLRSFQAKVQQTNYYTQLKKTITYKGTIYFTPGRMLMHFDEPTVQRLKIENGRIELYDASSNTLFRSLMQPEYEKLNPVEILQSYWNKSKVSIISETKDRVNIELVPQNDDFIKSLSATLDKNNGLIYKLSYKDKTGNSVTYNFSSIKLNQGISSSVWKYDYPKNVQIIES
ncbi:LolA family protein [Candidatus Syntrophosphaera thermopropionivorans]|jgi:outer membrane lipoprotein-sorting protein|uniref:Outer membrane lipoprotein carrier protein LolA n=1 Tax=Candidatus Syntrophosphaera thermopropionivorans TaxID=2593015 RepID=A0AC61QJK4_9BACT|nr:outer membrane lipoprotein carrier protein LolA [Candidatus Syntrophosphaera thermopropionivorans]TDF73374.1 outer membrane lipoprotein carrier protein LolA [Candidatus Syntrophosphaera thermopropionivorans]